MGWGGWQAGQPSIGGLFVLPLWFPLDSVPAGRGRRRFCWLWTEPVQKAVPLEGLGREGRVCSVLCWMVPLGAGGGKASWGLLDIRLGITLYRWKRGWAVVPL